MTARHLDRDWERRVAIIVALEALGDGDQALAALLLLNALEGGRIDDQKSRTPCPRTPCSFRGWPGQVDAHQIFAHPEPVARPARPPRRLVRAGRGGRP